MIYINLKLDTDRLICKKGNIITPFGAIIVMTDTVADPLLEIEAMRAIADALSSLDESSRFRALRWAIDLYGMGIKEKHTQIAPTPHKTSIESNSREESQAEGGTYQFQEISDLYAATKPTGDSEKALVLGYWFQKVMGQKDFDSGALNRELKNLGHGVSNITASLGGLISRKPALAMQTRKSGTSQQARKKYKLTLEGISRVEEMFES